MFTFNQALILLAVVFGISLCFGLFCGWLVFKSRNATQGESFIGGAPKGTVFTIPDAAEDDLDAEKSILDKSKDFLKIFEGGK
jgi:hypothetical protein